jgi:hypothetical protein
MLGVSKEPKNIPVAISILHEEEYKNICLSLVYKFENCSRRRAFSDKSPGRKLHGDTQYMLDQRISGGLKQDTKPKN